MFKRNQSVQRAVCSVQCKSAGWLTFSGAPASLEFRTFCTAAGQRKENQTNLRFEVFQNRRKKKTHFKNYHKPKLKPLPGPTFYKKWSVNTSSVNLHFSFQYKKQKL